MQRSRKKEILKRLRVSFAITLSILFVYFLFFEVIIPDPKFLPRPSVIFEAFPSVWSDYHLPSRFAVTFSVVYFSLFGSYILLHLMRVSIIKFHYIFPELLKLPNVLRYFPTFFFMLLFAHWFGGNTLAEFAFGFIYAFVILVLALLREIPNVKQEYLDAAKSLKPSYHSLISDVIWKYCQPVVSGKAEDLHYSIWIVVMIYEILTQENGIGSIYFEALKYKDLPVIILLGILMSFVILFGKIVIKRIEEKIVFWES